MMMMMKDLYSAMYSEDADAHHYQFPSGKLESVNSLK